MARTGNNRWLVIFDDVCVSDLEELAYLRFVCAGTIIAISRLEDIMGFDRDIRLKPLPWTIGTSTSNRNLWSAETRASVLKSTGD